MGVLLSYISERFDSHLIEDSKIVDAYILHLKLP